MMEDVLSRLREFIENEVRSGSMDFGCITPLYVYRMWGGAIPECQGTGQWHLLQLTRKAYLNCIYGKAGAKGI